jgi:choline kinase
MEIGILFMAAGLSSRFGGSPKILCQVGPRKETILEMNIIQMKKYIAPTQIHLICNIKTYEKIVSELKRVCEKHEIDTKITYNIQEHPWGTADALASASGYMDGRFILLNSDDLYGERTFETINLECNNSKNYLIGYKLINTLMNGHKANRGFISTGRDGNIQSICEKLNIEKGYYNESELYNQYVSVNLFILNTDVITEIDKLVIEFKDSYRDDYGLEAMLPDFINKLMRSNKIQLDLLKTDSRWCGVTFKEDIQMVKDILLG